MDWRGELPWRRGSRRRRPNVLRFSSVRPAGGDAFSWCLTSRALRFVSCSAALPRRGCGGCRLPMSDLTPVVVVGAGPAGVTAAWALLERGVAVTMLDAGTVEPRFPAAGAYLDLRRNDHSQWRWQLGETFAGLAGGSQASPKLRVPGLSSIF